MPPAIRTAFRPESRQVQDHLDRSPILLAEIHHPVAGILSAANCAREMRNVSHTMMLLCDQSARSRTERSTTN
jgi:hypothetical protein